MVDTIKPSKEDQNKVTKIGSKIGSGGRLYRDARVQDELRVEESAAKVKDFQERIQDKIEQQVAPPSPPPWLVKPMMEEPKPEPKPKRNWQSFNSTALEVAGVAALSAGFGMLHAWLGVVVLGICLIILGVATGLPPGQRQG